LAISAVNKYLAHEQHLLPVSRLADVVRVTRDIVALHATDPTSPYLSLWARVPKFQRRALEDALYERRELIKVVCMRGTLHAVPSDEVPLFLRAFQVYIEQRDPVKYRGAAILAQTGLCEPERAEDFQQELYQRILDVLAERGPSTVQEISAAVPELTVKIRHDVGKPYEGEFSVGSRLLPRMCAAGLLVRTRPRGTWRSNLYEYAALPDWLPDIDLESITPQEARTWVIRRYLSAFGPATLEDVQWWTRFTKTETKRALQSLSSAVVQVALEGMGDGYFMLADDAQRLCDFAPPDEAYVFFLPILDPYIMGYRDRRRFLAQEHRAKLFDRAGNAVPTVWVNGRVVGAWGQREVDGEPGRTKGSVVFKLFEPVGQDVQALLANEARRLEDFLDAEYIPPRFRTAFTRALG
jgi:hypothetical protein